MHCGAQQNACFEQTGFETRSISGTLTGVAAEFGVYRGFRHIENSSP
jgi:hypothetical protein